MDNYSRLVQRIEQRARRLQGVRTAGIGLALLGTGVLLVAIFYSLGILSLTRPFLLGLLAFPVLGAALLYLLGRRNDPPLPRLLLQIDLFLGTGERLSSMHELRRCGGGSLFHDRLAAEIRSYPRSWRKGLPLGRVSSGAIIGGGTALLAASLLIAFFPPSIAIVKGTVNVAEVASERERTSPTADAPELPSILRVTEPTTAYPRAEGREGIDHGLEDLLSDLWYSPTAEAISAEGDVEFSDLLAAQQEIMRELTDLLSRIEERLEQEEGSGLTAEEQRALADLAARLGGGSSLRRALHSLAEDGDSEGLSDRLKEIRDLTQSLQTERQRAEAGEPLAPDEERDSEEAVVWTPPPLREEEGAGSDADPGEGEEPRRSSVAGEGEDQTQLPADADADRLAGEEGGFAGEEGRLGGDLRSEARLSFLSRDLMGTIGEQGGFQEFVTKGVPLERLPADGEVEELLLVVDYEALRALLEGRALPVGREDVIRAYFEAITSRTP